MSEARIADLERRIAGLESRLLAVVGRVAELEHPVVAAARREKWVALGAPQGWLNGSDCWTAAMGKKD